MSKNLFWRIAVFSFFIGSAMMALVAARSAYESGFAYGVMCSQVHQIGAGPDCTGQKTLAFENRQ